MCLKFFITVSADGLVSVGTGQPTYLILISTLILVFATIIYNSIFRKQMTLKMATKINHNSTHQMYVAFTSIWDSNLAIIVSADILTNNNTTPSADTIMITKIKHQVSAVLMIFNAFSLMGQINSMSLMRSC